MKCFVDHCTFVLFRLVIVLSVLLFTASYYSFGIRAVTWGQKGVSCDDCNLWHHSECMHMPSHIYNCLNNISWNCVTCGMPQFTSSFFDSLDIHMQNSFSSIESEDSIAPPPRCLLITESSTPTGQAKSHSIME